MSLLDFANPISAIINVVSKVLDNVIPDPAAKAAAQLELVKLQQSGELAQLAADTNLALKQGDINVEEAKSESLFIAGWRPAVGWCCALGFFAKFLGGPLIFLLAQFFNVHLIMPDIDFGEMMPLLFGMLGLGAMRTVEKVKGK